MELRNYQKELITKSREALRAGYNAPIIVAPTGSGKTVMFSYITKQVIKKSGRVLILTHRREILEQTLSELYGFGITSGQIIAGRPMTKDAVQVAMIGTIANRLKHIEKPDLIIVDECHHSTAGQWSKVINYFYDVPRLGFTATPERLDGRGLGDHYNIMIKGPTTKTLVESGYLSYPRMFSSNLALKNEFHIKRGDYDKTEQTEKMTKRVIVGDVIDHYRKFLHKMPTIVFCVSIKHCDAMFNAYKFAGYKPVILHGKLNKMERDRAIRGLADGTFNQLISCEVVSEGFNVPIVAGIQMLRKTLSLSLYLQQAGRGLRIYEGKKDAIILDHVGNIYIHGHVLQDRDWDLHHGKRKPLKEKAPEIIRCPACFYVNPGKPEKCLVCGHVFEHAKAKRNERIEAIAGELNEFIPEGIATPDEVSNLASFIEKYKSMEKGKRGSAIWSKCYELADRNKIDALRRAVGYSTGWTDIVWNKIKDTVEV